ncbi:MAG: hypothetical protein IH602_05110 [Bryobacteraceae bacterium]|nr:hypothetical protein [Bryobacteraceae bacterium]
MNIGPPHSPHRNHFFLGLDPGKSAGRSALVILERTLIPTGAFHHVNRLSETAAMPHAVSPRPWTLMSDPALLNM